jgi:hypothetical protein
MRLSPSQSAGAPRDRAFLLRRDRAAAPVIRAVFPTIEQLRLELRFEGSTASIPVPQTHVLHPPARAYFVFRCPYADCDGQFDLAAAISATLEVSSRHTEGVLACGGMRVCNHASRRPCQLQLHYAVTATYAPGP